VSILEKGLSEVRADEPGASCDECRQSAQYRSAIPPAGVLIRRSALPMPREPLFERIRWRDPIGGGELEPIVAARTPAGVPVSGALRIPGTDSGYPIVDSVVRLTPELAQRHRAWLAALGLEPPHTDSAGNGLQREQTVESFGFQWTWNSAMRSEADLDWRVARQFDIEPSFFTGKRVLDAGAGAGDQSRWMLGQGAEVVSIDLSSAIDVVAAKLRLEPGWVGVQGDMTSLPFQDQQFEVSYCEGVIQHTRDSPLAIKELRRVLATGGSLLATHYEKPRRMRGLLRMAWMGWLRRRLSRLDRYKLLLLTGNLAALSYVPVVGRLLRLSGSALWYELMPDFRTTWTNTFDFYGSHAYQRFVSGEEFWSYFEEAGGLERVRASGATVVARRVDG
jgi:ubiquinone/menaquinone biosynthesis C-methylase UbiE